MKKLNLLLPVVALGLLLNSCSIEKRHYRSGYHIEWKHKVKTASAPGEKANEETAYEATPVKKAAPAQETIIQANPVEPVTQNIAQTEVKPMVTTADAPVSQKTKGSKLILKHSPVSEAGSKEAAEDVKSSKNPTLTNNNHNTTPNKPMGNAKVGLIILCFFIPWLAVGIATDWGLPVLWNILWMFTCIGAIIHAIIVVNREM